MLKFIESQYGFIPEVNQRRLASLRDPIAEAEQWVSKQVVTSSTLIVVGYGAGFHVDSLKNRYPEKAIFCIDIHKEIREFYAAKEYIYGLKFEDLNELLLSSGFKHQVLVHQASYRVCLEDYDLAIDYLNGRQKSSLKKLLELYKFNSSLALSDKEVRILNDQVLCQNIMAASDRENSKIAILKELLR